MFKPGDIITVVLEESRFHGQQGTVSAIANDNNPDGSIEVKFGPWCRFLFDYPDNYKNWPIRFEESDLRKNLILTPSNQASILFGPSMQPWFWGLMPAVPFKHDLECMLDECARFAAGQVIINVWGVGYVFYFCKEHARQWNGKCCEVIPPISENAKLVRLNQPAENFVNLLLPCL